MPRLIRGADLAPEYVDLLTRVSTTVECASDIVSAVAWSLQSPAHHSAARSEVASDLFHEPGGATLRAATELYALMELEAPRAAEHARRPLTGRAVTAASAR
jgi:hypothetical protein